MPVAPLPPDEPERLEALRQYGLLDTPREEAFDDLTGLAAACCDTPVALISLVDADRQWFKSAHGLDVRETHRDLAFCAHAIVAPSDLLVVEDAGQDDRFLDNPLVCEAPFVRAYAGVVLRSASGHPLGTLCVIDHRPRTFTPAQIDALQRLGRQARALFELHRTTARLQESLTEIENARTTIETSERRFRHLVDSIDEVIFEADADARWTFLNIGWSGITGFLPEDSTGRAIADFVHADDRWILENEVRQLPGSRDGFRQCCVRLLARDEAVRWIEVRLRPIFDRSGSLAGSVGTLHDITRQREMAAEITRAHQEALRTAAAMSDFVATTSHEIRTPVNGILGLTSVLLDGELTGEQRT